MPMSTRHCACCLVPLGEDGGHVVSSGSVMHQRGCRCQLACRYPFSIAVRRARGGTPSEDRMAGTGPSVMAMRMSATCSMSGLASRRSSAARRMPSRLCWVLGVNGTNTGAPGSRRHRPVAARSGIGAPGRRPAPVPAADQPGRHPGAAQAVQSQPGRASLPRPGLAGPGQGLRLERLLGPGPHGVQVDADGREGVAVEATEQAGPDLLLDAFWRDAMIAKDGTHWVAGGRDGQQEMFTAEMTVPKPVRVLQGGGENGRPPRGRRARCRAGS